MHNTIAKKLRPTPSPSNPKPNQNTVAGKCNHCVLTQLAAAQKASTNTITIQPKAKSAPHCCRQRLEPMPLPSTRSQPNTPSPANTTPKTHSPQQNQLNAQHHCKKASTNTIAIQSEAKSKHRCRQMQPLRSHTTTTRRCAKSFDQHHHHPTQSQISTPLPLPKARTNNIAINPKPTQHPLTGKYHAKDT